MIKTEEQLIRQCCVQIESELLWGPPTRWSNQDFERLSEQIAERTKTKLSVSTLKRVWGKVQYDSLPAITTLDALAQFTGHENWRDYWQKNSSTHFQQPNVESTNWWQKPTLRKSVFMLTLIVIGLIFWMITRLL